MKNFKIYQNVTLLIFILLMPLQTYSWDWYGRSTDLTKGAIIYNSVVPAKRQIALGVNKHGHLNTVTGNIATNASATGLAYKWPTDNQWKDATHLFITGSIMRIGVLRSSLSA